MTRVAPRTASLTALLEKCRAAVLGRPVGPVSVPAEAVAPVAPALPALPAVSVTRVTLPALKTRGPVLPSAATLTASLSLTPAAARVFELLHRIGAHVVREKGYSAAPSQVVFHLPASMLAFGASISRATLYRHLPALVEAGLIAHGGQASLVNGFALYGGCLWAVKMLPSENRPRLRREDWKTDHRDFASDIAQGRTAAAFLEGLRQLNPQDQERAINTALKAWTLAPGSTETRCNAVVSSAPANLSELLHALSGLASLHSAKQAEQVTVLGSALAHALDDAHSQRWYCSLLWTALRAEREGRGGLQVLAAQLARLQADRAEWPELRRPAALLASRLTV